MDLINLQAPRSQSVSYIRVISIDIFANVIQEFLVCAHPVCITLKMRMDFITV